VLFEKDKLRMVTAADRLRDSDRLEETLPLERLKLSAVVESLRLLLV